MIHGRARPPCPITSTGTLDPIWIPQVAAASWTIITRDKKIERKPAERQAVLDYGAKLFAITSPDNLTKWLQLEVVMSRWRDIEALSAQPGPFIYALTRSGHRQVL